MMSRATDLLIRQHRDSLGAHLRQCRTLSDRSQRALCSLEALDAAVGQRLFTTVLLCGLVMALFLGFTA